MRNIFGLLGLTLSLAACAPEERIGSIANVDYGPVPLHLQLRDDEASFNRLPADSRIEVSAVGDFSLDANGQRIENPRLREPTEDLPNFCTLSRRSAERVCLLAPPQRDRINLRLYDGGGEALTIENCRDLAQVVQVQSLGTGLTFGIRFDHLEIDGAGCAFQLIREPVIN